MPMFDAKDQNRYAMFTRRAAILSGGMTAIFAVLAARLYQLQILDGDEYLSLAEENRVSNRLLAPARARILDRFGVALATNRRNYRALIVPEQTPFGLPRALDELAQAIKVTPEARERILLEAKRNRAFVPVVVAENLSWEEFARLNLDLPYLRGVQPDVGETRNYPFAEEFSHVLGYVAQVSPEDKKGVGGEDSLLDVPGVRIGKRGIEKAFDGKIRGKAGAQQVEVNAYGRVIRELTRIDGENGDDLYLTVDRELQKVVYDKMLGNSGACSVMDVETGDVLAMVSTPGFDPNPFNVGVTRGQWRVWTNDEYKPLTNKAVSGAYPPGSTFKMITAIAALESGVIDADTTVFCSGVTRLGAAAFHCWERRGHGTVNLHNALKHSCDCYFYEVARRAGIDAIAETARKFGLGALTGIEIPGERAGLVPDSNWKKAHFKEGWQTGESLIAGIGQGYLLTTPLQLCTYVARLASGRAVVPRLVYSRENFRNVAKPLDVTQAALEAVRGGMDAVMNEPGGTAAGSRINVPGLEYAGKTGTAQVRRITAAERASGIRTGDALPWHLRDHGLFVAFAPVINPRYACSVVLEHGIGGARYAAPIARAALLFAQEKRILDLNTAFPVAAAGGGSRNL